VGVVATLWTLPIISHTFGNIPIIGIIITPFAIICAYIILGFGIFTLLLPPPLGFPFAHVAEGAAYLQNRMVAQGAAWDFSSVDYSLNSGMMTLCYAIFIVITIVVWSYEQKKVITLQRNDTL
jgi:competence protein ComEC